MSLRQAINNKCRECIYEPYPGGGSWRQQVEACTSPKCPLFPVRPLSKAKARVEPLKLISAGKNDQFGVSCDRLGGGL